MAKTHGDPVRPERERNCWPASPRDWVATQLAIRLGRLDRFSWFRALRLGVLSVAARRGKYVIVNTPFEFRMLLPCADKGLISIAYGSPASHPTLTRVLRSSLRAGDVVVDAGANFGFYSLLAASILRNTGAVIAFEPDPRNFRLFMENLKLNGFDSLVRSEEAALSDTNGERAFYTCLTEGMLSSLVARWDANFREIRVRSLRLDDYLSAQGVEKVDVVKLDLEGGEPLALAGMARTLPKTRMLIFEVDEPRLTQLQTVPLEFVDQVVEAGSFSSVAYVNEVAGEIYPLDRQSFQEVLRRHQYVNVICARDDTHLTPQERGRGGLAAAFSTNCRPASGRDWLAAHLAVRLGRLNRLRAVGRARERLVSSASRPGHCVRVRMPDDTELFLPSWDPDLMSAVLQGQIIDRTVPRVLIALLRPGHVVVDGGAHVGVYSLLAARLLRGYGRVISFEPEPRIFRILQRNIEWNGLKGFVHGENLALVETSGEHRLWVSPKVSTRSSLVRVDSTGDSAIGVRGVALDEYLRQQKVEQVDFLKLDLEGGEAAALRGMPDTLRSVSYLLLELNTSRLAGLGITPEQMFEQAREAGRFQVAYVLDEHNNRIALLEDWSGLQLSLDRDGFTNVLLCREQIPKGLLSAQN